MNTNNITQKEVEELLIWCVGKSKFKLKMVSFTSEDEEGEFNVIKDYLYAGRKGWGEQVEISEDLCNCLADFGKSPDYNESRFETRSGYGTYYKKIKRRKLRKVVEKVLVTVQHNTWLASIEK